MNFGGRGVERIAVQSVIHYHHQFMSTGIETDMEVLYLAVPKGERTYLRLITFQGLLQELVKYSGMSLQQSIGKRRD